MLLSLDMILMTSMENMSVACILRWILIKRKIQNKYFQGRKTSGFKDFKNIISFNYLRKGHMYDKTLKNIKRTWNFIFYTLDSNQPYLSEVSRRSLCLDSGQNFLSSHSCRFRPHSTACYQNLSLLCLVEEKNLRGYNISKVKKTGVFHLLTSL